MTFTDYLKLYFATFAAFLAIDMVWLGLVARGFYARYLGYLLRPDTNWIAAFLFYLLFILGLLVFVVLPGLKTGALGKVVLLGALFGLVCYATYDLTNLATVKHWPLILTVVDMLWGTCLSGTVACVGFLVGSWLQP